MKMIFQDGLQSSRPEVEISKFYENDLSFNVKHMVGMGNPVGCLKKLTIPV